MDSILTWKQHILFMSSKISKSLGIVSRLRHFVPTDTFLSIYRSLIQAYITYGMKEVLYEVRCLKWNEDMILALAGQFSGDLTGFEPTTSAMQVQCFNQLSYEVTQLRVGQFVGLMFSRERNDVWKKCYMKCGVWNETKIWSSHLLDKLSNCLINLKNSGDSTGFEPMTSAMPVQCSGVRGSYLHFIPYGIAVWGQAAQTNLYELLILQKRAPHLIHFAPYRSHAIPLFNHYNILPLNFQYYKSVCTIMHDVSNNYLPANISNIFLYPTQVHICNLKFSTTGSFNIKYSRTNQLKYSFSIFCARIWNSIAQSHYPNTPQTLI